MKRLARLCGATALTASLLASLATSQTLLIHGSRTVFETVGVLPTACPHPGGTVIGSFSTALGPPCSTLGFSTGFPFGGVAVHRDTDRVWSSNGFEVTEYDEFGVPVTTFAPPTLSGAVSGLGWDSASDILWLLDHVTRTAVGVAPPPAGCGQPATIAVASFSLGGLSSFPTGIAWDEASSSLFVCEESGHVHNYLPGGAPGPYPGPVPIFCTIGAPAGISVDTAASVTQGRPVYYVVGVDGGVSYQDALGTAAPPTFSSPSACSTLSVMPVDGCAFTARGVRYGIGGDTNGGSAPTIQSIGQSISPNPNFQVRVSNSVPGATAILYATDAGGELCPAVNVVGLPLHFTPQPLLNPGFTLVNGSGVGVLNASIPPGLAVGTQVDAQWLVLAPPSLQVSEGIHLTIVQF